MICQYGEKNKRKGKIICIAPVANIFLGIFFPIFQKTKYLM